MRLQRQYGNRFVQRIVICCRVRVKPVWDQRWNSSSSGSAAVGRRWIARLRQIEPAMGADFSGVRVHTGGQADALNRNLSSRAFTTRQDIFFKQGEYSPGSSSGRELLAHELTHVVQQDGDRVRRKLTVGAADDRYEHEVEEQCRERCGRSRKSPKPSLTPGPRRCSRRGGRRREETPIQAHSMNQQVQRQEAGEKKESAETPGPPTATEDEAINHLTLRQPQGSGQRTEEGASWDHLHKRQAYPDRTSKCDG